jgi:trk system potassium uptake protein
MFLVGPIVHEQKACKLKGLRAGTPRSYHRQSISVGPETRINQDASWHLSLFAPHVSGIVVWFWRMQFPDPITSSKMLHKGPRLWMVPVGFGVVILLGALLLSLPFLKTGQGVIPSFLDTLFVAVSATCVTGLSTFDIGEAYHPLGLGIVAVLIQVGGLGIFTAGLLITMVGGDRPSLAEEKTIDNTIGKVKSMRPKQVFGYACFFIVVFEILGVGLLFLIGPPMGQGDGSGGGAARLGHSVFHAVSAFCNAGFSSFPEGLSVWRDHGLALMVVNFLVIGGGIGLITLIQLRNSVLKRDQDSSKSRWTIQTRLCLWTTVILLILGTLATLVFEWNHTLRGLAIGQRVSLAFVHSVMLRTAGFSVVDLGQMNPDTILGSLVWMYIGGCPGSMSGGIKTVTFAVILMTAWSALRRRESIQLWGRKVEPKFVHIAVMISFLAGMMVLVGVGALMITEGSNPHLPTDQRWLSLIFEVVSAFSTVGLSLNVTPHLSSAGKMVVMALMFIGRVGPLMLAVHLSRPLKPSKVNYPKEDLSLG